MLKQFIRRQPRLLSTLLARSYTTSSPLAKDKAGMAKWYPIIGEYGKLSPEYLEQKKAGLLPKPKPAPIDLDDYFENLNWVDGPEKPVFPLPFNADLPLAAWLKDSRLDDMKFASFLDKLVVTMQRASGLTRPQIDAAWLEMIKTANNRLPGAVKREKLKCMSDLFNPAAIQGVKIDYGARETFASLRYRTERNFVVSRGVMAELKLLVPDFNPATVMDFGCGTGSASIAAMRTFSTIEAVHGIDVSQSQRDAFHLLTKTVADSEFFEGAHKPMISSAKTFSKSRKQDKYDLVLLNYVCHEQFKTGSVLRLVRELYSKVKEGGLLVVVEPGTPLGYRNVMLARTLLLNLQKAKESEDGIEWEDGWGDDDEDEFEEQFKGMSEKEAFAFASAKAQANLEKLKAEEAAGLPMDQPPEYYEYEQDMYKEANMLVTGKFHANVIAPCMHRKACPLFAENLQGGGQMKFCSFSQKFPTKEKDSPDEKYCYIVLQKQAPPKDWEEGDEPEVLREEGEDEDDDEWDEDEEEGEGSGEVEEMEASALGRLIRNPRKRSKHVILDTCTPLGTLSTQVLTKGKLSDKLSLYRSARKAKWGGLFPHDVGKIVDSDWETGNEKPSKGRNNER
jgi:ribosomal protein RSM22 (predicted rRNA methylase)